MDKEHKVWLFYLTRQLELKHDFEIIDKSKPNWQIGRGPVDTEVGGIAIKYHWKDLKIQPFDQFMENKQMYGYDWFLDVMQREEPYKFLKNGEFKKAA